MFTMYHRPRGPMDKASDFESEDCGFDPHRGHFPPFKTVQIAPGLLHISLGIGLSLISMNMMQVMYVPESKNRGICHLPINKDHSTFIIFGYRLLPPPIKGSRPQKAIPEIFEKKNRKNSTRLTAARLSRMLS